MTAGFVGLGVMGAPMAANLCRGGVPLVVWNRTGARAEPLRALGATVARDVDEVFGTCDVVLLMMADAAALDDVLGRGTASFDDRVSGRTVVHMGTTPPAHSAALAAEIAGAGGRYVEAPVSGSRVPAENAELVGMVAGDPAAVTEVVPLLRHMCRDVVACGEPPNALRMKLAVNLFLITMVTGLAEAAHFAAAYGLDMEGFRAVVDAGPMASAVSKVKLRKLVEDDFDVQASITNVLMNNVLVAEAAREAGIASPLLDACHALYAETDAMGLGGSDMIAVLRGIEARTAALARGVA